MLKWFMLQALCLGVLLGQFLPKSAIVVIGALFFLACSFAIVVKWDVVIIPAEANPEPDNE